MSHLKSVFFLMSLVIFSFPDLVFAQQPKQVSPAPVPRQILAAKKVFIANAGGDNGTPFAGGPDRAYNQLYAAIRDWGQCEIVDSPASAELPLEVSFTMHHTYQGQAHPDSQLRLQIRDAKTQTLLWGLTEHIQWAMLQANRDKNFDESLKRFVAGVKALLQAQGAASSASKSQP